VAAYPRVTVNDPVFLFDRARSGHAVQLTKTRSAMISPTLHSISISSPRQSLRIVA
jgi:hypothetical protein